MTTTASSTRSSDLVRVVVAWAGQRTDLVVPARVAVAELAPALATAVEALDPEEVHRGCALVDQDGRVLDPETGLREQGVSDGQTVTLVLGLGGVSDTDAVIHDDLADAVTDALVAVSPSWGDDDSRRSSLLRGGLGLAGGAVLLGWHHSSGPSVAAAAALSSLVLLAAGAATARRRPAHLLLLAAGPYAAVAGFAAAPGGGARPWLWAGLALVLAGAAAGVVMTRVPVRWEPASGRTGNRAGSTGTGPRAHSGPFAHPAPQDPPAHPVAAPAVPWLIGGSSVTLAAATVLITSLPTPQVVTVLLVGLLVLAVVALRLVAPSSPSRRRMALTGLLGVDLILAGTAPIVVTGGGWAGLGLIGVGGLLMARHTRSLIGEGAGSLLDGVAVGAALAGPVLASVTGLSQLPSLLPSLLPSALLRSGADGALPTGVTAVALAVEVVVATGMAAAAPILTFSRTERRSLSPTSFLALLRSHDRADTVVEMAAVVLLVALLARAVGLVSGAGP